MHVKILQLWCHLKQTLVLRIDTIYHLENHPGKSRGEQMLF